MPSLNYTLFLDKVIDGTKPHTIRALRKMPIKIGDDLSHFTGMRTKACRRLRPNTNCTAAVRISIFSCRERVILGPGSRFYPWGSLGKSQILDLALRDGFGNDYDFFRFFEAPAGDTEWRGQLIEWMP